MMILFLISQGIIAWGVWWLVKDIRELINNHYLQEVIQVTIKQAIARLQNLKSMEEFDLCTFIGVYYKGIKDDYDGAIDMAIEALSAQPETFEWCHDCKEYDQEQHCCHRCSQQIRKTIEELEASYPQEAKEELLYWKERAAKWERDYYTKTKKGDQK